MIKVNDSKIKYKLKILPKAFEKGIESGTKYHAEAYKETLIKGLKAGNLVQPKISSATKHIRTFYPEKNRATAPLVGSGSLIDNIEIAKVKRKWIVRPNNKMVTSSPPEGKLGKKKRISVKRLWAIHENGAVIPVTPKMRSAFKYWFKMTLKTNSIVIPARQAWKKARARYIRSQARKEANKNIQLEIKRLLK